MTLIESHKPTGPHAGHEGAGTLPPAPSPQSSEAVVVGEASAASGRPINYRCLTQSLASVATTPTDWREAADAAVSWHIVEAMRMRDEWTAASDRDEPAAKKAAYEAQLRTTTFTVFADQHPRQAVEQLLAAWAKDAA